MRGRGLVTFLICLPLSLVLVGCSPEEPQPPQAPTGERAPPETTMQPVLDLSMEEAALSDGRILGFEIGYITVPENRSNPERTIQVEVARVRRQATADPATPPIFFLPGGPGFPGVRSMLGWDSLPVIVDMFTSVSDLVIVGQRGIGSAIPSLGCDSELTADLSSKEAQEQTEAAMVAAIAACRDRWRGEEVDLPAYSVPEAAADVRDVAVALSYPQITLWGVSFGSHWSMAIMRFHPEIVARAVLGGLEGPDHTYDMPGGVLAGVRRMALEASESEALAAFTPEGGWLAAFRSLIGQLNESPLTVSVDGQEVYIDGEGIKGAALGYSQGISSRSGMRHWPADVHRLLMGDFEALARAAIRRAQRDLPPAAFFALDCGSGITAEREAVLNADPGQAIVGNLSRFYQQLCPVWEVDLTDAFRTGFETDIPTLLVHGTYDVNTPYSNAQELLPSFTNSTFVTVDGGSHGALQEALGADEAFLGNTLRFLATGELSGFPERVELDPIDWIIPGADAP